jgi:small subunit ribosomal protein S6
VKIRRITIITNVKRMNTYETVFILTPVLSDEQMKEAVVKFKDVLQQNGAEIVNEEEWGLRKLAYPIQKKSTGFYCLLEFKGEPTIVKKLDVAFRRDERVIRFLTFRLDKYAQEYAEKRRNLRAKKASETPAEATAAAENKEA